MPSSPKSFERFFTDQTYTDYFKSCKISSYINTLGGVTHSHLARLKCVIAYNIADINTIDYSADDQGQLPIITAIQTQKFEIVDTLIKVAKEAKVSLDLDKMHDGQTPLTASIALNNEAIVNYLIEEGANPDRVNEAGETPFFIAMQNSYFEIATLLLEKGIDFELPTSTIRDAWVSSLIKKNTLIKKTTNMRFVILKALLAQDKKLLLYLEKENEELCIKVHQYLALRKKYKKVHFDLGKNAEENTTDALKTLAAQGVPVNIVTRTTPESYLSKEKSPLSLAIENQNSEVVAFLVTQPIPPHTPNDYFTDLLQLAIFTAYGNTTITEILLENAVKYNDLARQCNKELGLLAAIVVENSTIVDLLLKHGADVNACDEEDNSPLLLAVESNVPLITEQLLKAGAIVHAKNKVGETPLAIAQHHGDEMVALLERYQTDAHLKNFKR